VDSNFIYAAVVKTISLQPEVSTICDFGVISLPFTEDLLNLNFMQNF